MDNGNWEVVYSFSNTGEEFASRTNKFGSGKFLNPDNPKDGYTVVDCENERNRMVLMF